jgi:hypothetical protein
MALTLDGTNGIVSSGSITTQSATGVIFSDSSNQGAAASPFSLKNRIINGDMVISQRNGTSSVTPTLDLTYTLDRWAAGLSAASKYSIQQNAGSVTPPAGFTNYLGITSTSAYSVSASDFFYINQRIEANNVSDLAYGTASAATLTLSFWVRSSLTGTFGGSLYNQNSRSYPFTYSISSANTWTKISVTIPGDTTTAIPTGNGLGLLVSFGLGVGSTYNGTAGAWASGLFLSATGAVSVVGTNGATFYVTGVQLERNTTATPFEYIPYGMELMLCQRYYQRLSGQFFVPLYNENTTSGRATITYPVTMRIAPIALEQSGTASDYNLRTFSTGKNLTSVPSFDQGTTSNIFVTCPVSTGVGAAGGAGNLNGNNSNAYLGWSAEL